MPDCNAFIESRISSAREELLDNRIVFDARDLLRLLKDYVEYFNQTRLLQSLGQDSPCKQQGTIDFDR
jgi:transposase InsO family protein